MMPQLPFTHPTFAGGDTIMQSDPAPVKVLNSIFKALYSDTICCSCVVLTLLEYTKYSHGPPHGFTPIAIKEHPTVAEHEKLLM